MIVYDGKMNPFSESRLGASALGTWKLFAPWASRTVKKKLVSQRYVSMKFFNARVQTFFRIKSNATIHQVGPNVASKERAIAIAFHGGIVIDRSRSTDRLVSYLVCRPSMLVIILAPVLFFNRNLFSKCVRGFVEWWRDINALRRRILDRVRGT